MIEPRVRKCTFCESEKIVVCRLKGMADVVGVMNRKSALFADVCTDCGQIISMRAEHPKNLKGEYRND